MVKCYKFVMTDQSENSKQHLQWLLGKKYAKPAGLVLLFGPLIYTLIQLVVPIRNSDVSVPIKVENNIYGNMSTHTPESSIPVAGRNVDGLTNAFNPDDWVIDVHEFVLSDGFYCAKSEIYQYAIMWSKNAYSLEHTIKMRFDVRNSTGVLHPPTVIVAFGQYIPKYSPKIYYRVNVFDGSDVRSIRLYNNVDNRGKDNSWLSTNPDIGTTTIINTSTKVTSDEVSTISVFVDVIYAQTDGKNIKSVT